MKDVIQETIASYEIKAEEYIRNTDQLSYFPDLPAMLDMFLSMLPGRHILDIAFGSGRDTFYFIEHGLKVEGIELTQAFIDSLRKKIDIPLYKMDMRGLTFKDSSFDGIWCCSAFLHLPRTDALRTLKGFYRILRAKGILYIDLKEGNGEMWVQNNDGHVTEMPRFFTYYQLEEICALLLDAGFRIEYTRKQRHPKHAYKHSWLNIIALKNK
ncbi:MAG TPA: class I SAM-dependent methyltransferase [Ktedonobacteraceae bacterium]|nr:class I SAM-dependent methyltransferase [Ktedonobacteraceae bacterium]